MLCFIIIVSLAGCGGEGAASERGGNQAAGVNDVLAAGKAEADSQNDGQDENAPAPDAGIGTEGSKSGTKDIDIDLTALSSTMVYSEVYNMMSVPENYMGKKVKMGGAFAVYHDEKTDNYYYACIIKDATACCSQGIEFVLAGDYKYPDDYPQVGEDVCVVGEFDTYKEGEYTYCTLRNAELSH